MHTTRCNKREKMTAAASDGDINIKSVSKSPFFFGTLDVGNRHWGRGRNLRERSRLIYGGGPGQIPPFPTNNPTNDALFISFRLSRIFVNNHRLSVQIGARRAKTCMQRVHVPAELPLCMPPLLVGLLRTATHHRYVRIFLSIIHGYEFSRGLLNY